MPEQRLADLGIILPEVLKPVANYLGVKRSGDLLYVSGQIGDIKGAVGADVTLEEGQECARQAVLYMLAKVKLSLGRLDRVTSVDKLLGFVRSAPDFTAQPRVIDGASDLLIAVFGEEIGAHSRTATGVLQCPYGAAVQLEMTLRIRDI